MVIMYTQARYANISSLKNAWSVEVKESILDWIKIRQQKFLLDFTFFNVAWRPITEILQGLYQ